MGETLTHQNGDIRKQSQLIIIEIYNQFGFEALRDFAQVTTQDVLQPLVKRIPELEPYVRTNEQRLRNAQQVAQADSNFGTLET